MDNRGSVAFGPLFLILGITVALLIFTVSQEAGAPLWVAAVQATGFIGLSLGAWAYLARRTGNYALVYGWGVDHMGPPRLTFRAFWDDIRGDDDE